MDDMVVWKFQSLCGENGMKYGVASCFELCYELCTYYVGILSVWAESLCSKISTLSSVSWFIL